MQEKAFWLGTAKNDNTTTANFRMIGNGHRSYTTRVVIFSLGSFISLQGLQPLIHFFLT